MVELADQVGSTDSIIRAVDEAPAGSVLGVGTEIHLVKRLDDEHPDQTVVCLDPLVCPCSTMSRIDAAAPGLDPRGAGRRRGPQPHHRRPRDRRVGQGRPRADAGHRPEPTGRRPGSAGDRARAPRPTPVPGPLAFRPATRADIDAVVALVESARYRGQASREGVDHRGRPARRAADRRGGGGRGRRAARRRPCSWPPRARASSAAPAGRRRPAPRRASACSPSPPACRAVPSGTHCWPQRRAGVPLRRGPAPCAWRCWPRAVRAARLVPKARLRPDRRDGPLPLRRRALRDPPARRPSLRRAREGPRPLRA